MKANVSSVLRLTAYERRKLMLPAAFTAILVEILIICQDIILGSYASQQIPGLAFGAVIILYTVLLFTILLPSTERYPQLHWLISIVNGVGFGILTVIIFQRSSFTISMLGVLLVVVSALVSGRWPTHLFIILFTVLGVGRLFVRNSVGPQDWWWVISLPIVSVMITETILHVGDLIGSKVERLEIIRQSSRQIASTIEVNQVISLVSATVQDAILADTYYVGLLEEDQLRLDLLYDDGEFFNGMVVPLGDGLASWVIEKRRSLLIRDLPREMKSLGIHARIIGQPKISLSWMGTPMEAGSHLVGIIAMASYQQNAFDESDLELLESLAKQAALVIDNAYHHAEVEKQSRLDSLTQVYNHGHFLNSLEQHAEHAHWNNTPLSLIMLDIDFFKHYNDLYGHPVGDLALKQVVAAIRQNIRNTDVIGRWGGEEFAILLPGTDGAMAHQVAARIQSTLQDLDVISTQGEAIRTPTVSQGIAAYEEVTNAERLVEIADQRLYMAKSRGRDQVEPPVSHWQVERIAHQTA